MQTIVNQSNEPLTAPSVTGANPQLVRGEIARWLREYIANLLALDPATIDGRITFDRYGLDSSAAVGMTGDLAGWLGYEVDAAAPYDYPSIDSLSHALASDEQLCVAFAAARASDSSQGANAGE